MKKGLSVLCCLLLGASMAFAGGKQAAPKATVDLNSLTMEQLIALAKEEGHIESVGMPGDWANWDASWKGIQQKYGITHHDTDMRSSEQISAFQAEKDSPTRDIGEVGQAYGAIAIESDVVQGYRVSTWDSIPDWAKDPQGRWIITYVGTMALIVNHDLAGPGEIRSWQDFKNSKLKLNIGDVVTTSASQMTVLSAAYAFGGSLTNIQPGIDFFKELARAKRIDNGAHTSQRWSMGEIEALTHWDYQCLGWRDLTLSTKPDMKMSTHVFNDGAIQIGYCLIFNKYAPHPAATALALEYFLSDEGQLDRARGYTTPIRKINIPSDLSAKMIPSSEYTKAIPLTDATALAKAVEEIARKWEDEVVPLLY
jgi:putative spermidine/putrescine transport system substrate-binding protein